MACLPGRRNPSGVAGSEAGTEDTALPGNGSGALAGRQGHGGVVRYWRLVGVAARRSDLSRGDIAVLWAILDRIGADGTAWPGYGRIAADTGLCRSTVTRCIRKLVAGGLLHRDSGRLGKPNRYTPGRCSDAPKCEGEPRRNDTPRCSTAPRRSDETRVEAGTPLGVGAQTLPEPASLNLLQEPAKATVHSAAPTAPDHQLVGAPAMSRDTASPAAPEQDVPARIRGETKPQTAARFPEFWACYPIKKGRADALRKWKAKGLDAEADAIIAHVRRMERDDDDWLRGFIPHGSTYINGERWEDEPKKEVGQVTASAPDPAKVGSKAALASRETPLEREINWIRQQRHYGAIDNTEARSLIAEAHKKHGSLSILATSDAGSGERGEGVLV